MTITEKKPLLIQIPGEITPNELPVSASAVGYDFIQGNYLIYATGSDSWVTAPPNTAGIQEYWQSTVNNNIFTTGSIKVSGSVILGDAASDVVYISGSVTASNGLTVTGSVNVSNGVKVAAGGLQVAGIVPGISEPYNNSPIIIDLAAGQTYGPVIRSVAGQYNFAALSLDQNGTYLGGIYGIENDPAVPGPSYGYVDGVNIYSTGASRKINFNVNQVSVGRFTSSGLQVTGSINGSSTITAATGFSGSLTTLTNGSPYLISGPGVTITTGSIGQIFISGSSAGITGKQHITSKEIITSTSPVMVGQFAWVPSDYTGLTSVSVRAIIATDGEVNLTGSLQIYNLTSGSYVDLIDTPTPSKYFNVTSSAPTFITSSNLLNGNTNFNNTSESIYEVRVSGSTIDNVIVGSVELIFR